MRPSARLLLLGLAATALSILAVAYDEGLRQAALAGDLWSLDDVSNFSRRDPAGGAYKSLYGVITYGDPQQVGVWGAEVDPGT